ncbi:hypothetical protein NDU88_001768 [Pleurodeles waltl]|uniref:Uncharacterized protein n=1 Tax=Pleurodeles waltl TaxID=8319 RepID=A0AAV7U7D0_PLEWA|nr:hypothetical protein NDU88_001768 [Pleurodeles waltl]
MTERAAVPGADSRAHNAPVILSEPPCRRSRLCSPATAAPHCSCKEPSWRTRISEAPRQSLNNPSFIRHRAGDRLQHTSGWTSRIRGGLTALIRRLEEVLEEVLVLPGPARTGQRAGGCGLAHKAYAQWFDPDGVL